MRQYEERDGYGNRKSDGKVRVKEIRKVWRGMHWTEYSWRLIFNTIPPTADEGISPGRRTRC